MPPDVVSQLRALVGAGRKWLTPFAADELEMRRQTAAFCAWAGEAADLLAATNDLAAHVRRVRQARDSLAREPRSTVVNELADLARSAHVIVLELLECIGHVETGNTPSERHGAGSRIQSLATPERGAVGLEGAAPAAFAVFVVAGHERLALAEVTRCLVELGARPVFLAERAPGGRTIVESIEHFGDARYAVVLLTPDDVGAPATDPGRRAFRARQNVILELGYFWARLGRDRMCILKKGDIEIPSDFAGIIWRDMDDAGAWRMWLASGLVSAGLSLSVAGLLRTGE